MTAKEDHIEKLGDEFGNGRFTSMEACDILDIEWAEFMELFVDLNQKSGSIQKVGERDDESLYKVIDNGGGDVRKYEHVEEMQSGDTPSSN